jgi:hypothetical protein
MSTTSTSSNDTRPYSRSSVIRLIAARESLAQRGDATPEITAAVDRATRSYEQRCGGKEAYIKIMLGKDERGRSFADLPPELCKVVFTDGREEVGRTTMKCANILDWLLSLDELPRKVHIVRPSGITKRQLS